MEYKNARIVSYNLYGERVCAGAAKISTTKGNAFELFDGEPDHEADRKLIGKVLNSGHSSVIEHAVFSLALKDVTVCVEEFFIEHRLASFTVKSRRYVDFSALGFYVPQELSRAELEAYNNYMQPLFEAYSRLTERGIPMEDARFLLPYSFYSNFYCTLNARELVRMIADMKCGRGRNMPELQNIAAQLEEQLLALFPSFDKHLASLEKQFAAQTSPNVSPKISGPSFVPAGDAGTAQLLSSPQNPKLLIEAAASVSGADTDSLAQLLASPRPRELEMLNYAFSVKDVSLPCITHIVRHRMQSVIIPDVGSIDMSRVIVPDSVHADPAAEEIFTKAVSGAFEKLAVLKGQPHFEKYRCYYAISGMLTDIILSMNARELLLFIQLRSCNRAQWEIRKIATGMLALLRESYPELFDAMGPSCFVKGYCPEGRMCCGRQDEVRARFSQHVLLQDK